MRRLTLLLIIWPVLCPAEPYRYVQSEDSPNFLLWLPADYAGGERHYPLLLFLHGLGEKGDGSAEEIERVATHGPFRTMREGLWDHSLPLIVAGPQIGGLQPWWPQRKLRQALEHMLTGYRVDPGRVYLSGISMGGRAVWEIAEDAPDEIAAIVPVGGWATDLRDDCERLRHLGVWAFHGEEDTLIRLSRGRKPVEALLDCQPPVLAPVRLSVLEGSTHGDWELVFDNRHGARHRGEDGRYYSDIYRWMLSFDSGPR